jgi:hypothetical protein
LTRSRAGHGAKAAVDRGFVNVSRRGEAVDEDEIGTPAAPLPRVCLSSFLWGPLRLLPPLTIHKLLRSRPPPCMAAPVAFSPPCVCPCWRVCSCVYVCVRLYVRARAHVCAHVCVRVRVCGCALDYENDLDDERNAEPLARSGHAFWVDPSFVSLLAEPMGREGGEAWQSGGGGWVGGGGKEWGSGRGDGEEACVWVFFCALRGLARRGGAFESEVVSGGRGAGGFGQFLEGHEGGGGGKHWLALGVGSRARGGSMKQEFDLMYTLTYCPTFAVQTAVACPQSHPTQVCRTR